MINKIGWCDVTWNPITGCSHSGSPGCDHCYAESIAKRFWNGRKFGDVRFHEDRLMDPLHWKKPRKIFLGSMTDLFHPLVPFGLLDQIFAIVALCQQHTFQILTKRPERMKEYFDTSTNNPMADISIWANSISEGQYSVMGNKLPLPNLWIGVTAENQACADKRIPILLQIPAAVRFVSIEPMLGLVDLNKYNLIREDWKKWMGSTIETYLDWVICGPENGKIKRECNIDWEIDLYRQCKETNTAFYCKNDIGLPKEFPTWANNDY